QLKNNQNAVSNLQVVIQNAINTTSQANIATDNANSARDDAIQATNNANIATQAALDAAASTIVIYKDPVVKYEDILITYPNPENGWRVMVEETGDIYRFDGVLDNQWKFVENYTGGSIPFASETTSGLLHVDDYGNFIIRSVVFL